MYRRLRLRVTVTPLKLVLPHIVSEEYHLPDYTEPEPKRRPARPRRKVKLRETT